jgi:ferredoxin-thioredoxin reductase catalytic subunit
MSNPTQEQRAREILKRLANKNGYETWADFVCVSNDQFLTNYTVKAMLEFATPEKEVDNIIKCPSCGADWSLSVNNACSCGAWIVTANEEDKTAPAPAGEWKEIEERISEYVGANGDTYDAETKNMLFNEILGFVKLLNQSK